MPIFDYKCIECGNTEEIFVKQPVHNLPCPKCSNPMAKQASGVPKHGVTFTGVRGSASMKRKNG